MYRDFEKAAKALMEAEEKLLSTLNEEEKKVYEQASNAQIALDTMDEIEKFVQGVYPRGRDDYRGYDGVGGCDALGGIGLIRAWQYVAVLEHFTKRYRSPVFGLLKGI